jgi:hypothetical protein
MTRGEKICSFIEHFCLILEGTQAGQAMKLMTLATQAGALREHLKNG